jgi:imidazoleglycerol-phosphate dehydratase
MKKRTATINRKSKETNITIKVNIDGKGKTKINTRIGFLDHMLELFAYWGLFDLDVTVAKGDFNIDIHHTNEDVGMVLGQAFKKALGDKKGIKRFGSSSVPMEEVVADVSVDLSGRGSFKFVSNNAIPAFEDKKEQYTFEYAKHFFESFASHSGLNFNLHICELSPDLHKTLEPAFKALGIALDQATQVDPRRKGVPSTKGIID